MERSGVRFGAKHGENMLQSYKMCIHQKWGLSVVLTSVAKSHCHG